ncbi:hypothetical protein [Trichlorobacter lovleyi]|uniref:Secreted protein n=1 Tax=Trichlorobacter lovleyi (strain ATCC BAA-1151 / DSM 17278 / SZ) TaxID=398767 RepID=B3E6U4_TRIL1|nr:hypothetical protein [Trichlorobacter lovleyi]ACD96349.1 hypothetical protein Glov_2636 [Trichlorobacter lovleyi SZ]
MLKRIVQLAFMIIAVSLGVQAFAAGDYRGDERCPRPTDWSNYSEPYDPLEHPRDYPTFDKADRPGWSCSYQREDGVVVQYGDSRTPQQQWLDMYGGGSGDQQ